MASDIIPDAITFSIGDNMSDGSNTSQTRLAIVLPDDVFDGWIKTFEKPAREMSNASARLARLARLNASEAYPSSNPRQ